MSDAVLGVEKSVSGRFWRSRLDDPRLAAQISQTHDLPEPVGRVLAARGVSAAAVEDFLNPRLRAMLPDPSRLAGMDEAVARLSAALAAGEKIAVLTPTTSPSRLNIGPPELPLLMAASVWI